MRALWTDDAGYVYVVEIILAATLLAIGLVTGLAAMRNAAVSEMHEVANALLQLNQSYSFPGNVSVHQPSELDQLICDAILQFDLDACGLADTACRDAAFARYWKCLGICAETGGSSASDATDHIQARTVSVAPFEIVDPVCD